MTLGQNIERLRIDKGISQEKLGEIVGRSKSTISLWEADKFEPNYGALEKMADYFSVPKSTLLETNGSIEYAVVSYGESAKCCDTIPIYGSIAAGTPIEMIEVEDYYTTPTKIRERYPKAYFLRVEGESMNRRIPNGSLALIDPSQKEPCDMKPYALCINGYDATIKCVHPLHNGYELVPDSYDPTFERKMFNYSEEGTDEITILGRVVWVTMPVDYEI